MSEMLLFLSVAALVPVLLGVCLYRWLKLQQAKRELRVEEHINSVRIAALNIRRCCEVMVDARERKMAANSCPQEESEAFIQEQQVKSRTGNVIRTTATERRMVKIGMKKDE